MSRVLPAGPGLALVALLALLPVVIGAQVVPGKPDAGGMPAPTVALERGRAVYVLNTCHFCHGVDLTKATMGAAVLLHSPLVGADENGNVIGAVVRAGIPNLQTSMPAYPDLTNQEVEELAAYIHYLRQLGRHKELMGASVAAGDAAAGRTYFAANCASCHAVTGNLKGLATNYDAATLRARVLGPPPPAASVDAGAIAAGRRQHLTLLEKYSDDDVNILVAYLQEATK
ncbi:MAG: c-type cytochrome [Vicinamibacteria bacterium]|nr:c-type cytochrome [Vicinamibacteria bacterium]